MAKKQGKVKAIPAKEVTEGMQITWLTSTGRLTSKVKEIRGNVYWVEFNGRPLNILPVDRDMAEILIVEYEISPGETMSNGNVWRGAGNTFEQVPLKFSQWQAAIENGEVDSNKVVEFEFKNLVGNIEFDGCADPRTGMKDSWIAKIIPQKRLGYENTLPGFNMDICRAFNAGKQAILDQIQDETKFKSSDAYFKEEFPEYWDRLNTIKYEYAKTNR